MESGISFEYIWFVLSLYIFHSRSSKPPNIYPDTKWGDWLINRQNIAVSYVFVIDEQSEWRSFKCQVSTYHKLGTFGVLRKLQTLAQQYFLLLLMKMEKKSALVSST